MQITGMEGDLGGSLQVFLAIFHHLPYIRPLPEVLLQMLVLLSSPLVERNH